MYVVQLSGVVIGHSTLERFAPDRRSATGVLEPTPEFGRWSSLAEERRHALDAADRAGGNIQERRRNRELVDETLGWRVLDSRGRHVGRVVAVGEAEGGGWEVEVLFEEPGREQSSSMPR